MGKTISKVEILSADSNEFSSIMEQFIKQIDNQSNIQTLDDGYPITFDEIVECHVKTFESTNENGDAEKRYSFFAQSKEKVKVYRSWINLVGQRLITKQGVETKIPTRHSGPLIEALQGLWDELQYVDSSDPKKFVEGVKDSFTYWLGGREFSVLRKYEVAGLSIAMKGKPEEAKILTYYTFTETQKSSDLFLKRQKKRKEEESKSQPNG